MTMIKNLEQVDMTVTGALTAVELGATPFFPGANAILHLTAPIGGAGVITVEGSGEEAGTYTAVQTINAAQSAGLQVEVSPLPKWIRLNVTTAGTGTIDPTLEGVQ